jgi:hypothetical protein
MSTAEVIIPYTKIDKIIHDTLFCQVANIMTDKKIDFARLPGDVVTAMLHRLYIYDAIKTKITTTDPKKVDIYNVIAFLIARAISRFSEELVMGEKSQTPGSIISHELIQSLVIILGDYYMN